MSINIINAALAIAQANNLDADTIAALKEQLATLAVQFTSEQRLAMDIEQLDPAVKSSVNDTSAQFMALLDTRLKRASGEVEALDEQEWERLVNEATNET